MGEGWRKGGQSGQQQGEKSGPKHAHEVGVYQRRARLGKSLGEFAGVGVIEAIGERHNSDMRVLLAPTAFKGSLGADEVAHLVSAELANWLPEAQITEVPIADGGDGTLSVLIAAGFHGSPVDTVDALMRATKSQVARQGATVVIELAETCGLAGVQDMSPRPWDTSTLGVGLAAHAVLASGAKHLLLAVGGSASVDGGLGLLAGLGYGLLDVNGAKVPPTATGLERVSSITPPADQVLINACDWTLLVDVDSPACGPHGAAQVFGPQKGFTEDECYQVDAAMGRWCEIVSRFGERFSASELRQLPGAGAAGGFAVAASGVIGASISSGSEVVGQLTNLAGAVADADVVIIGEGRLDEQTLVGKGPAFVASIAKAAGKPVFALAGSSTLTATQCLELGIKSERDVVTLVEVAGSVSAALEDPRHWISVACALLGERLAASGI